MPYFLAMIFLFALGLSYSSAATASGQKAVSLSRRTASAHTLKASRQPMRHRGRDLGGIHPLVGSGDY
jgi:hypothetical protein